VCVDVSPQPSCADAQSVDGSSTTTTAAGRATGAPGSGNATDPPATDPTAVLASSPASSQSGHSSDPTLPFTGAALALLTLIGLGMFGSGTMATRFARGRNARNGA
jgi:hypothetical protein